MDVNKDMELLFSRTYSANDFPKTSEVITIDKLRELAKLLEPPKINIPMLDEFVTNGGSMENLHWVTSHPEFRDVKELNTQHGKVIVKYTPMLPKDTVYFMNPPKHDYEYWMKMWNQQF